MTENYAKKIRPKLIAFRRELTKTHVNRTSRRRKHATGIPLVDTITGGGVPNHGVIGVVAPIGVGASVLATMIAGQGILNEEARQTTRDKRRGWLLFDRQNESPLTYQRLVSYVSGEPRNWMGRRIIGASTKELPGFTNPKIETAKTIMNNRLPFFDPYTAWENFFTAWDKASELPQNFEIAGIVIDNLSNIYDECKQSWAELARRLDIPDLPCYFYLSYLEIICRGLAERYKCPVWVIHRASGKANAANPTAALKRENVKDCKLFAEYLDTCLILGNKSPANDLFAVRCVKSPYMVSSEQRQIIVSHNKSISTINEVSGVYADHASKQWLLPRKELLLIDEDATNEIDFALAELSRKDSQIREKSPLRRSSEQQRQIISIDDDAVSAASIVAGVHSDHASTQLRVQNRQAQLVTSSPALAEISEADSQVREKDELMLESDANSNFPDAAEGFAVKHPPENQMIRA